MAGSVNKMILVGHLGRDPEVRHTQSNLKIVHVWMAPVLQGLSCVLLGVACGHVSGPWCGLLMTAGPDGFFWRCCSLQVRSTETWPGGSF